MTIVDTRRAGINTSDVKASLAVRGLTHNDFTRLTHWTLGRGAQLVPGCVPGTTLTVAGGAHLFQFRVRPRYQALQRHWYLDIRQAAAGARATASVKIPSSGSANVISATGVTGAVVRPQLVVENVTQSSTEGTLEVEITPVTNSIVVQGISCFEVPRGSLGTGTSDDGTDVLRFNTGQPIDDTDFTNLRDVLSDPTKIGRRASLFQWAVPAVVGGATSTSFAKAMTSASYTDIFALPIPVLARKLGRTATTGTITCKFLAWVTANNADLRMSSSVHGASSAVNITTTTPAWSNAITLAVDCEDLDSADGRQTAASPAWDELDVQVRQNTAGTCYVAGVSIWED